MAGDGDFKNKKVPNSWLALHTDDRFSFQLALMWMRL